MRKKKEIEICVLECIKNFIGVGRLHPDSEEICFEAGKQYYFILKPNKEIFAIDETKNVHFFNINDPDINTHFYSISSGYLKSYTELDEVTMKRLEKLYKERRNFSE